MHRIACAQVGCQNRSVGQRYGRRRTQLVVAFLVLAAASACAETAAGHSNPPVVTTPDSPAGRVFVMEPIWRANESGNTGRDFRTINAEVTSRILAIVRERFPESEAVDAGPRDLRRLLPGYPRTVDAEAVTTEELNAAIGAYEHGATYLLVPTITEWKEMRTDDPIGAFILPHNSVAMTLRLMRLQAPFRSERVVFKNRARLTLNQRADRLLNGRFRSVVLGLVSGNT
jgi:hypothetical protein